MPRSSQRKSRQSTFLKRGKEIDEWKADRNPEYGGIFRSLWIRDREGEGTVEWEAGNTRRKSGDHKRTGIEEGGGTVQKYPGAQGNSGGADLSHHAVHHRIAGSGMR